MQFRTKSNTIKKTPLKNSMQGNLNSPIPEKVLSPAGLTLMELLLGTVVTMIIMCLTGFAVRGAIQRTKVAAAKATISSFALGLGMVKDDTGLYSAQLSDTKNADPPQGVSYKDWCGPYAATLSLNDPWGNAYFYQLQEGIIFGPDTYERQTGPPFDETYAFSAPAGNGTLHIDNYGVVHAGWIWINGVQVVFPNEFQDGIPVIEKLIDLTSSSSIRIRLASNPTHYIVLKITSPRSKNSTFTLGSYGQDGAQGGTKYAADITYGQF